MAETERVARLEAELQVVQTRVKVMQTRVAVLESMWVPVVCVLGVPLGVLVVRVGVVLALRH